VAAICDIDSARRDQLCARIDSLTGNSAVRSRPTAICKLAWLAADCDLLCLAGRRGL